MRMQRGPRPGFVTDVLLVIVLIVGTIGLSVLGVWLDPSVGDLVAVPIIFVVVVALAMSFGRQRAAERAEYAGESLAHRRGRQLSTLAVLAFLAGTFTWRGRTASALSSAPVDTAASARIIADAVALGLVFLALTMRERPPQRLRAPAIWYGLYIVVVLLGATTAVDPPLVLFRVFDLLVVLLVAATVVRWQTLRQAIRLARRIMLAIAALILAEAAVVPSLALEPARGGIVPFRLDGVFPIITYNSVGAYGVLLVALGFGAAEGRWLATVTGVLLVLLSQYRTGYLAVAAILVVFLIARRGTFHKIALVAAIPVGYFVVQSTIFQDAWTRGEQASNSVATLSGRTDYWAAAIHVAARSPIIGTGLSSGTRFEAFPLIGNDTASTIHGTWIEAYLGTGAVGTFLLAGFVIASLVAAWRARSLTPVPLLLLVSVLVRSATGTTIELAQLTLVFVLILAIKVAERPHAADALPGGSVVGDLPR